MVEQSSFQKLLGTKTGNYRLEQLVERDGIGPIFIARDTTTNSLARLRMLVLPEEQTAEARIVFRGRFQQEANLIASLQHPHILPLVDYGNPRACHISSGRTMRRCSRCTRRLPSRDHWIPLLPVAIWINLPRPLHMRTSTRRCTVA